MKHFILRLSVALSVFAAVNVLSFFARSDDLFTPDMPDAMTRFGFPFLVYQNGGPVALCFFSRTALYGNVALAVALSIGVAALFPCIRRDVLRTLGYERKTS
jgi:hypothetical protein